MSEKPWRALIHRARVDIGARGFCLFAGFVLTLLSQSVAASAATSLLLTLVAAAMASWATLDKDAGVAYVYALVAEAAFAVTLVGLSTQAADAYILYLGAPALLAGLRGGLFPSCAVVAVETLTLVTINAQQSTFRDNLLELGAPWILTAGALAVLGSWIRVLRRSTLTRYSPYASAHRLLAELRTVTRGLPGGLDIEAVSQSVLATASEALEGSRAALLLVMESGELVVLRHYEDEGFAATLLSDPLVRLTIEMQQAMHQPVPSGQANHRFRSSLPLMIGTRCIGAVVVDSPEAASMDTLLEVQGSLDDAALRLESAVLFGDVRALATVEERHRLAREIHDGVAQEIASLGYFVDDLARQDCSHRHQEGLNALRDELTRIVTELRLSIFDLRSGVSSNAGLGSVLSDYVREMGKSSGMTVHLSLEESRKRLRLDVETELLRIAQEAISNARRHSEGANLWVSCRVEPPFAEIRIEDDGRGSAVERKNHYGLHTMKERAKRINAVLTVADRPGGGTTVTAVLLPAETAAPERNGEPDALQSVAR